MRKLRPIGKNRWSDLFLWKGPPIPWNCSSLTMVLGIAVALHVHLSFEALVRASPLSPEGESGAQGDRGYQQWPGQEHEEVYRRQDSKIRDILRADTLSPEQEQALVDYYSKYALIRWTFLDRQEEVVRFRRNLLNELKTSYKPNRSNLAHDRLAELTFQFMKICLNHKDHFAPTVRFNAILMIGELNKMERTGSGQAVPWPGTTNELLKHLETPQETEAIRVGALIGIQRHCRLMMANGTSPPRSLMSALWNIARTGESEQEHSEVGRAWMRAKVIQILGEVRGAPRSDMVAGMLRDVVAEQESPDFVRYAAAKALEGIDYRVTAGINMDEYLHSLGALAIEVCDKERRRLRNEAAASRRAPAFSGYGSHADMGEEENGDRAYRAMGPGPATRAAERQVERARRRLKEGMAAVLAGMGKTRRTFGSEPEYTGLSMLAGEDPAKRGKIEAFSDTIHDFFKVIDTKKDGNQIEAKPLDEAIGEVRDELADALRQVGPDAPTSPEFEPLPESRPLYEGGERQIVGQR